MYVWSRASGGPRAFATYGSLPLANDGASIEPFYFLVSSKQAESNKEEAAMGDLPEINPNRPTSIAAYMFRFAWTGIVNSKGEPNQVADALSFMLQGLEAMATASRATYIKLEQIEALIRQGQREAKIPRAP